MLHYLNCSLYCIVHTVVVLTVLDHNCVTKTGIGENKKKKKWYYIKKKKNPPTNITNFEYNMRCVKLIINIICTVLDFTADEI